MSGRPVVFLHGFLGSSLDWLEVLSYLPSFKSYLIDLPGHGKSAFHPELILPHFEEKIDLVGYSMGGRLALQYAAQNPQKIEKLILLSTHLGLFSEEEILQKRTYAAQIHFLLKQEQKPLLQEELPLQFPLLMLL